MGLLNSIGQGIGAAAQAAQPFVLNMQQAEIQKLRDERMAEIAKGTAKYSADLEIENIPRKQAAELPGLLNAGKAKQALEYSPEAIAGEAALAKAKHIESPDRDADVRKIQLEALQGTAAEKKAQSEWMNQYEAAKPNSPEEDKLRRIGIIRGYIKPSANEDEETTYVYDDAGNKISELKSKQPRGANKAESGVPSISTIEEYNKLPSGAKYIGGDGQLRTKR